MSNLEVIKFINNSYLENTFMAYEVDSKYAFVVDPGGDCEGLLKYAASQDKKITDILITHGHFDHILALKELKHATGATIYVHMDDAEMLTSHEKSLGTISDDNDDCSQCPADVLLGPGSQQTINVAGIKIQALHTPGHSNGSMSYYLPQHAVVFTGDTLFRRAFGRTDFPGGSAVKLRASLRMLLKLDPKTKVYAGHDKETTIGQEAHHG